jgi:hypothetical protein
MIRIGDNAIHRTNVHALGSFKVADTFGAEIGVDLVDLFAHGNRPVRALGLTDIAVDAFVGNQQRHKNTLKKIRSKQ